MWSDWELFFDAKKTKIYKRTFNTPFLKTPFYYEFKVKRENPSLNDTFFSSRKLPPEAVERCLGDDLVKFLLEKFSPIYIEALKSKTSKLRK